MGSSVPAKIQIMGHPGEKLRDEVFQAEKRSQGNKEIGAEGVTEQKKGWLEHGDCRQRKI